MQFDTWNVSTIGFMVSFEISNSRVPNLTFAAARARQRETPPNEEGKASPRWVKAISRRENASKKCLYILII